MNYKRMVLSAIIVAAIATSCGITNENIGDTVVDPVVSETTITTVSETEVTTTVTDSTTESETITTIISEETTSESVSETVATDAPVSETPVSEVKVETEPVTETEPIKSEPVVVQPVEEFLVYKPSTKYAHKNTCHWNSGDAYRCDNFSELETRICSECNPNVGDHIEYVAPEPVTPSSDGMTYVGDFQATYYTAWIGACGGSGRSLIDCSYGSDVKGSIASSTLYNLYGYYRNGRTTVYIECDSCPSLTGYYYLDDSTASWVTYTIDFYYESGYNCPFQYTGRLYGLRVYI